jgi:predicted ABC-type ATPase
VWADARRAELLNAGQSFVSETVFSHASKLALIEEAQAQGQPIASWHATRAHWST